MNNSSLSELRRRLNPDKRYPTMIRGCYASPDGEILRTFRQDIINLTEGDNEKFMTLFKKVLSGSFGQQLTDLEFSSGQVLHSEEYALLLKLRETRLKDEDLIDAFFNRIISTIPSLRSGSRQSVRDEQEACNWLILVLFDGYEIPFQDENGEKDMERSVNVFDYFICCICPVRPTRSELTWRAPEGIFSSSDPAFAIGMPETGFLFPAFEDGGADLYHTLLYSRSSENGHDEFIRTVLGAEPAMPPKAKEEAFKAVLEESLGEECSLEILQAVHETVNARIEEQKADKKAEPLQLGRQEVRGVLAECGVSEEKAQSFEDTFSATFGENAEIPAVNLIAPRKFDVSTPNVTIKVKPEFSDLIETRIIEGKPYLMVPVDGDVEVNGVRVHL